MSSACAETGAGDRDGETQTQRARETYRVGEREGQTQRGVGGDGREAEDSRLRVWRRATKGSALKKRYCVDASLCSDLGV